MQRICMRMLWNEEAETMAETGKQAENGAKNTVLMTEGNIFRCIVLFAIPLILGNILQQTYNAVDSIIVGNFVGSSALAAVGSSTSLINLLISFSQGAAVGAGVVVSQSLGANDWEGLSKAVHTALVIAAVLGCILSLGGVLFSRRILVLMNTPEEVLANSTIYLGIYSAGLIFNVLYNMCAGILNAAGNSKRSLMYLGAASVTNIVLDLILIVGFRIGVAGAAIATTASQAVSFLLAFHFLLHVPSDYRVSVKQLRLHSRTARRILALGLPAGIQSMLISFSNMLVQASVNRFGATAMAGFGAYLKIDGFGILPILSIGMAMTTYTGQNFGAGKIDRIKKGIGASLVLVVAYTGMISVLLLHFADPVMRLFTQDPAVIAYGETAMRYFCPFYWVTGILQALAGTVRGTGKTVPPMIVLILSFVVFRIMWIYFVLPRFHTIEALFMQYPICWALGVLLMLLYMSRGTWLLAGERRA